jgi:hypothetical protein
MSRHFGIHKGNLKEPIHIKDIDLYILFHIICMLFWAFDESCFSFTLVNNEKAAMALLLKRTKV